ncbi:MAG: exonuclease domain-containing protein, partial [Candidatus Hodgkinia cicadicola]
MIKELIVDTETTGLNVKADRIIELAAIELIDGKRT